MNLATQYDRNNVTAEDSSVTVNSSSMLLLCGNIASDSESAAHEVKPMNRKWAKYIP